MAESLKHIEYVRKIVSYLESTMPSFQTALIQADLAEYGKRTPQVIGGYYPDVYYRSLNCFIIGEAKTDSDIDNHHTNAQIDSYILELRTGCQEEKHIILSTSVYSFAMLKNMIVRRKEKDPLSDITFHIIDNISRTAIL